MSFFQGLSDGQLYPSICAGTSNYPKGERLGSISGLENTMLVAVDVGNSNVSVGVFAGDFLEGSWKFPADQNRSVEEYVQDILIAFRDSRMCWGSVKGTVISSVVREMADKFVAVSGELFGKDGIVVSTHMDLGLEINLKCPEDVGTDRLLEASAAYDLYKGPCVVVDVGTAITVDAVSVDGKFLGGAIAPGLNMSLKALSEGTSLLPCVELSKPDSVIGKDSPNCIRSGVVYGSVGLIDGLVEKMKEILGQETKVIATGGDAELISGESKSIQEVDLCLVLKGLRSVYIRNWGTI